MSVLMWRRLFQDIETRSRRRGSVRSAGKCPSGMNERRETVFESVGGYLSMVPLTRELRRCESLCQFGCNDEP